MTSTRQPPRPLLLMVLAGLGMVGPFTIDTIFPAFGQLAIALDASPLALQQLVSVYLLSFAAMSLFHGPISDAVGRKPVILTGLVVYAAASAVSAVAPDLGTLLVLRAVQGASAGAGQIISRAVVSDLFQRAEAQRVMSHIAMIFGLAPALAPIVGGWLLLAGPWQAIYWFLAAFGLLLFVLTALVLPESHPSERRTPLRVRPLVAGVWSVWRDPDGRRLALAGSFNFAGMFTYIASAPLLVFNLIGGGEQDFWMLFVPLIGGMVVGSYVSGRIAGRFSPGATANAGYAISCAAGAVNLLLALVPATQVMPWAVVCLPVYSFGIALAFPIITLEMIAMFPTNRGAAASVQSFVQLTFNALIAGVVAALVAQSLAGIAATALAFSLIGWVGWRVHLSATRAG